MVGRDAAREGLRPRPVPQDLQVLGGDGRGALLRDAPDLGLLRGRRQAQPRGEALLHGALAPGAGEDEVDRGQQPVRVERVHDGEPGGVRRPTTDRSGPGRRPAAAVPAVAGPRRPPGPGPPVRGAVRNAASRSGLMGGFTPGSVGSTVPAYRSSRSAPGARRPRARPRRGVRRRDEDVLPQRHGPALADDDGRVAAHHLQPVAELLRVGHGRGQGHELYVVGQVDDHLFPHRPAEPVGEVVHLVHDDVREPVQGARPRVQHVAQHLGRHDDDGRLPVDRRVPGEQAHGVGAVAAHEVRVLLVRQRLDGVV